MENLRYQRSVIKTGREEGREEGRKESTILIAQNMKKEGLSISLIVKMTGLSEDEINRL